MSLPAGFEALEPFAEAWAVAGMDNRRLRRLDSTEAERDAFYPVAKAHLASAMEYLDARPLNALAEDDKRLLDLMLMTAHLAAVDRLGSEEAEHSISHRHFRFTRSTEGVLAPVAS